MLDIVFSYGWEPVPVHRIRMNTRNGSSISFDHITHNVFLYKSKRNYVYRRIFLTVGLIWYSIWSWEGYEKFRRREIAPRKEIPKNKGPPLAYTIHVVPLIIFNTSKTFIWLMIISKVSRLKIQYCLLKEFKAFWFDYLFINNMQFVADFFKLHRMTRY